jgi:hypothetical protein
MDGVTGPLNGADDAVDAVAGAAENPSDAHRVIRLIKKNHRRRRSWASLR